MSRIYNIFNLGTAKNNTDDAHLIRLSNKLIFFLICVDIPFIIIFPLNGIVPLGGVAIACLALLTTSLFLNHKKKYIFSRLLAIATVSLTLWIACLMTGRNVYIQSVFFPLAIYPLILFPQSKKMAFCVIGFILTCFYSLEISDFSLIPTLSKYQNIVSNKTYLSYASTFSGFLISVLTIDFLYKSKKDLQDKLIQSDLTTERLAQQSTYARLVRGIAHEIRNPLAGMFTRAELIQEDPGDVEEVMEFCDVVLENLDRLNNLTTSMLKYGDTSKVEQKIFDSKKMIEGMVSISHSGFRKKNLILKAQLVDDAPIFGNETFIHSAISNLLANALQYTQEGEVTLTTQKVSYTDLSGINHQGIKVSVADTGTGIPADDIDKIFDPYFTNKKSETNVGLGLAMAYKFITESDGLIQVDSTLGQGTTFEIFLPSEAQ